MECGKRIAPTLCPPDSCGGKYRDVSPRFGVPLLRSLRDQRCAIDRCQGSFLSNEKPSTERRHRLWIAGTLRAHERLEIGVRGARTLWLLQTNSA
jgi:hypothetical protein